MGPPRAVFACLDAFGGRVAALSDTNGGRGAQMWVAAKLEREGEVLMGTLGKPGLRVLGFREFSHRRC